MLLETLDVVVIFFSGRVDWNFQVKVLVSFLIKTQKIQKIRLCLIRHTLIFHVLLLTNLLIIEELLNDGLLLLAIIM